MSEPTIRLATPADREALAAIYGPIVRDTTISFELDPPPPEEMARRVESTLAMYPWLVYEEGSRVLGYAYATSFRPRLAYRWSVETSVYIDPRAHRRGVGRGLYRSLFGLLALQGFVSAFAGIALPNPASVALHEKEGFELIGVYRHVGFKLGDWRDVGWWQRDLNELAQPLADPLPLPAACRIEGWDEAMAAGLAHVSPRAEPSA